MLTLLAQSDAFHAALEEVLEPFAGYPLPQPRHRACAAAASLSVEHGAALRLAFGHGMPSAATALLRPQYEALVRSAWSLHAATDEQVAVLMQPLDADADLRARKLPQANDMLTALDKVAPAGLLAPLREFHGVAWTGLNSYIHAGLHPIARRVEGYPEVQALQLIRNSNGLLHFAYRLMASLTGSPVVMATMTHLWGDHRDCFPVAAPMGPA